MKVLVFAGSLRKASFNKKLAQIARALLEADTTLEVEYLDLQELQLPVYDGDIEAKGIPQGVQVLAAHMLKAQAFVISSPEYNGSISSPLKNAIDWASRTKPEPIGKKAVLLLSVSAGPMAGIRGWMNGKWPFDKLGAFVYSDGFNLGLAGDAFNDKDELKDSKQLDRLEKVIKAFIPFAKKITA